MDTFKWHEEAAATMYGKDGAAKDHPVIPTLMAQDAETEKIALNRTESERRDRALDVVETTTGAGFGPYDRLTKTLSSLDVAAAVRAKRGTTVDPTDERERFEQFVAEQRALRSDAGFELLQARVHQWLSTQPRLSKLIERAGATRNPEVLNQIFDHVHRVATAP